MRLLAVLLLSLFASSVQGQISNSGNKFYLAFFPNGDSSRTPYLVFVTAADDEMVTFSITAPGRGYHTTATVGPGQVKSFTFDESYTLSSSSDRTKAIIITAEENKRLVVYGANEVQHSTDTFLALPPLALSSYKYIAVGYIPLRGFQSLIAIVATEDDTILSITPTQSTVIGSQSTSAGATTTITLNRAETLLIRSPDDLTGTIVVSNKSISLFSGDQCVNIPPGFAACDLIVEQIPPVETWGTAFATAPILTRKQYDKFRLVSGGSNNRVIINCTLTSGNRGLTKSFTLATEGSYQDFDIPSTQFCWIQGSAKMLLVQFSVGQTVDGVLSDPFMAIVPPYDQYSSSYTAVTVPPATQIYKHYLNIFIRSFSYQPDEILLNGTPINGTQFVPIKQYDKIQVYAAQIPLPDGVFTLKHTGNPELAQIGIIVYGLGQANSYGYPGGLTFSSGTGTGNAENSTNVIGLVPTKKSGRRVTVEWFQPITDGEIEYYRVNVYKRLKKVLPQLIRNFTTTDTSVDIDGLQPGTNYSVTVKTVVEGGEAVPEVTVDVSTVKPNITKASVPLVKATPMFVTTTGIYLRMQHPPGGLKVDGYTIKVVRLEGASQIVVNKYELGPKVMVYRAVVTPGYRYCFKMRALIGKVRGRVSTTCIKY